MLRRKQSASMTDRRCCRALQGCLLARPILLAFLVERFADLSLAIDVLLVPLDL